MKQHTRMIGDFEGKGRTIKEAKANAEKQAADASARLGWGKALMFAGPPSSPVVAIMVNPTVDGWSYSLLWNSPDDIFSHAVSGGYRKRDIVVQACAHAAQHCPIDASLDMIYQWAIKVLRTVSPDDPDQAEKDAARVVTDIAMYFGFQARYAAWTATGRPDHECHQLACEGRMPEKGVTQCEK